jgi:hypothetical protein
MPGAAISELEITNISQHGFWLLLDGRELFLPSTSSRGSGRRPCRRF